MYDQQDLSQPNIPQDELNGVHLNEGVQLNLLPIPEHRALYDYSEQPGNQLT